MFLIHWSSFVRKNFFTISSLLRRCRNGGMNRDVDRHKGRRRLIIRSVEWEFAYFHKYRYFPLELFPKLCTVLRNNVATARRSSHVLSACSTGSRREFITLNVQLCVQHYGRDARGVDLCKMWVGPNSTVCWWNENFRFCCHKTMFMPCK